MNRLRAWMRLKTGWIPRPVRRAIVLVIGGTLLALALVGMALPIMPGFIFLPLALAILAIEFAWAARWLKRLRRTITSVHGRVTGRGAHQPERGVSCAAEARGSAALSRPAAPPRPS